MYNQISPFLVELCEKFTKNAYIPPEEYKSFNIKRGLRNADGTGVMAGITKIGSVQGYDMLDGEPVPKDGRLFYRGIDVEEIVSGFLADGRQGFAETAYLLLFGELPNQRQHERFFSLLTSYSQLPSGWVEDIFLKYPGPSIMNMLTRSVLALYAHDHRPDDISLPNMMRQCIRLIAVFPSLVASGYAARQGYYDPAENLEDDFSAHTIAENFLYRFRPDHSFSAEEVRLLDLCMVLHAEHGGGNNSAFTCRVLSSTACDTYSAIAGAVSSLSGPLHGGANLKVNQMVELLKAEVSDTEDDDAVSAFLLKVLRKEAGDGSGKIYGMGHAIYTLSDPRAILLKKYAKEMCETRDKEYLKDFELLERIERLSPEVFQRFKGGGTKVICANVDFYSGLVYRMLGIPEELFTPLFAIARVSGWAAHRIEEVMTGGRIIRPAYKAITLENPYIPLQNRN